MRLAALAGVGILVVAVAIVFANGLGSGENAGVAEAVGSDAPPLSGETLAGGTWSLADRGGDDVVLVNVWASWCAPCREEMPLLREVADTYDSQGLTVVGLNTKEPPEAAREFLDEIGGVPYPSVIDEDGETAVAWGVFGMPETFVVSPDGEILAKHAGAIDREWIAENVVPALEGAA